MGDNICMYSKSASSGVEFMNKKTILLDIGRQSMSSMRWYQLSSWRGVNLIGTSRKLGRRMRYLQTSQGLELMEEAFRDVNLREYQINITNCDSFHRITVSRITFDKWIHGYHSSEGNNGVAICCRHMVVIVVLSKIQDSRLNQDSHNAILVNNCPLTSSICNGCLLSNRHFTEYSKIIDQHRWKMTLLFFVDVCKEEGAAQGECLWKECCWFHQRIGEKEANQEDENLLQNLSQVSSQHGRLFSEPYKSRVHWERDGWVGWGRWESQGVRLQNLHRRALLSSMGVILLWYLFVKYEILTE